MWYRDALIGDDCCNGPPDYRCEQCEPNGFCDRCHSFEGRGIEQMSEYASTCDGCGELVHHDLQRIPPESGDQLGYCEKCRPDLFDENREAIEVRRRWMALIGCDESEISEACGNAGAVSLEDELEQLCAAIRLAAERQ